MAVDPVSFIPPLRELSTAPLAEARPAGDFASWMGQALGQVNGQLTQADAGLQALAAGRADNLHQVMISLEEARLGLQLVVQVRNRLLEAYQDILRMQV